MNPSCPAQGAPRAPQGSGALRCSAVPQTRNGCHGYPEGCAQERRLPLKATICSQLLQACLRPYSNRGTWLLPQTSVCKPSPARTAFPVPTALSNNTACHFYLKTGVKIAPQKHCHLHCHLQRRNGTPPPISCSLCSSPFSCPALSPSLPPALQNKTQTWAGSTWEIIYFAQPGKQADESKQIQYQSSQQQIHNSGGVIA